jgi:hypothetical protein
MATLRLKDDIARKLVWSAPDSKIAPFCSVCQAHIPDDDVPLMMWNDQGACVQFCDDCSATAFNL